MNEYRICKYNPRFRVNGVYIKDEWTSVSDIGKTFEDGVLTEKECRKTVNGYVTCLMAIFQHSIKKNGNELKINGLERWSKRVLWKEGQIITADNLEQLIRDCLNEKCWCRIENEDSFIHFGYELYVYVGCDLDSKTVMEIAQNNGLFADVKKSPYHCICK